MCKMKGVVLDEAMSDYEVFNDGKYKVIKISLLIYPESYTKIRRVANNSSSASIQIFRNLYHSGV